MTIRKERKKKPKAEKQYTNGYTPPMKKTRTRARDAANAHLKSFGGLEVWRINDREELFGDAIRSVLGRATPPSVSDRIIQNIFSSLIETLVSGKYVSIPGLGCFSQAVRIRKVNTKRRKGVVMALPYIKVKTSPAFRERHRIALNLEFDPTHDKLTANGKVVFNGNT